MSEEAKIDDPKEHDDPKVALPTPRKVRRYGWRPDLPDRRDRVMKMAGMVAELPRLMDLESQCPAVYDQGELGSCTANAIAGLCEFLMIKQKGPGGAFMPSRLFIYWLERAMEGTIGDDAGAMIRDGMKVVGKWGVPHENPAPKVAGNWPYDIEKFKVQPPSKVFGDAYKHKVRDYVRVPQNLTGLRGCLAGGTPVVFGFTVYDSFESDDVANSGLVPMPKDGENVLGGHAVLLVGYDDTKRLFKVRNSWGESWGQHGYCQMPYEFLTDTDICDDFWTSSSIAV